MLMSSPYTHAHAHRTTTSPPLPLCHINSPLVGFMADGIPIYGPLGVDGLLPEGLDMCNGHASDLPFYHYHFTSDYPYSVDCLWGQLDGTWNSELYNLDSCEISDVQYNYSALELPLTSFGGDGKGKSEKGSWIAAISILFISSFALITCQLLIVFFYIPYYFQGGEEKDANYGTVYNNKLHRPHPRRDENYPYQAAY